MSDTPAREPGYFLDHLRTVDPEVHAALAGELARQQDGIELIASENLVSRASLDALGSVITNKTVEGRPGARYYGGAAFADRVESLAIERAKQLFGCAFANVQPHSGSQANQAVFLALLQPGDTVLSMALDAGGHLSHGAAPNLTGKWFNPVRYRTDAAASSTWPRSSDWRTSTGPGSSSAAARPIRARSTSPASARSPIRSMPPCSPTWRTSPGWSPAARIRVPCPTPTSPRRPRTKNLRGARGGIILTDDAALARKLDSAVFPGVQGSVILNAVAAKAVCLAKRSSPSSRSTQPRSWPTRDVSPIRSWSEALPSSQAAPTRRSWSPTSARSG